MPPYEPRKEEPRPRSVPGEDGSGPRPELSDDGPAARSAPRHDEPTPEGAPPSGWRDEPRPPSAWRDEPGPLSAWRDEPTPQEAARALRELAARSRQAQRSRSPRWIWCFVGAYFPVTGLAEDMAPRTASLVNACVVVALLTLAFAVRFRPVGAALGYRLAVRGRPPAAISVVSVGGIAALAAVQFALRRMSGAMHSHWSHTIAGVVIGPLFAFGLPWLIEQAYRQHEEVRAAGHGNR